MSNVARESISKDLKRQKEDGEDDFKIEITKAKADSPTKSSIWKIREVSLEKGGRGRKPKEKKWKNDFGDDLDQEEAIDRR
jgi:hypothetical protein